MSGKPDTGRQTPLLDREDYCDDCELAMPLTGDSLCGACEEADRRRFECPACGSPVMYLVRESRPDFCSDACEAECESWPEP